MAVGLTGLGLWSCCYINWQVTRTLKKATQVEAVVSGNPVFSHDERSLVHRPMRVAAGYREFLV
jgi:hypothetical protein